MNLRQKILHKVVNLYPPFLGAGIKVRFNEKEQRAVVTLKLGFFNRNYVGTHYGGSLYSMCDPFYMILLIDRLGPGYIVWDRSASIVFKRPGTGTVKAEFFISDDRLREIRDEADRTGKSLPVFTVDVTDRENRVVATVEKHLSVRKKDGNAPPRSNP